MAASSGALPSVAPDVLASKQGDGGAGWADAGVICPWTIWKARLAIYLPAQQAIIPAFPLRKKALIFSIASMLSIW